MKATRRSRQSAAHVTARAKMKRSDADRAAALRADALRTRRVGLLYGLAGLFTLVVGGLVVARPRPLSAGVEGTSNQANVVLTAIHGTNGPADNDYLEAALQAGASAKPGNWTGVTVLSLTTTQARMTRAHFKVVLEGDDGPQLVVGTEWLRQTASPMDPTGEFVLVVVVDDHEREVKGEATVVALVSRLCTKLRIDPTRVQWS